jgi:hypothetical protein
MHPLFRFAAVSAIFAAANSLTAQQITLAGLRSVNGVGAFHGLKQDAAGNLYTLLDAHDGIRLIKFNATGTTLLAQVQIGTTGDAGVALDLDPTGNVYVAGTSNSLGSLTGTAGTAFPNKADTTTNGFVAKFSSSLAEQWLTFCGSGKMAVTGIAATSTSVLVTGSIFASTLPVTSAGIQQTPATGSNGNGFVESFTATGTLGYATYLTGYGGDTAPAAIAADAAGNAYIAGSTSSTGYPTTAALVPIFRAPTGSTVSGFVTKLDPAGDGFLFSTFVPGSGLTSIAVDTAGSGSLLVAGNIASGLFPLTNAQSPIAAPLSYQSAIRIALDGSSVLSSTLLAPAAESFIAPGPSGAAWIFADTPTTGLAPLLPIVPVETIGNAYAFRVASSGDIDRTTRLGGAAISNSAAASLPVTAGGILVASSGAPTLAGSAAPTLSSSLLPTQQYDLPLTLAPNAALPSTVRDALPSSTCNGSACSGSAGLLVQLAPDTASPALALSTDALPNLTLRNAGTATANGLQISATGYTASSSCGSSLAPGAECSIALAGSGPGSITLSATNATAFTTALPAVSAMLNPIAVLPRELDFGIHSGASAAGTRTLTIANLGSTTQTFVSQNASTAATAYTLSEANSTCTPAGDGISKILAAGGTCTITLQLKASTNAASDATVNARWKIGASDILITAYAQAAAISLSTTTIDFGRQYTGGLRTQRFLYLSNASDTAQSHAAVTSSNSAFTITDECPATLQPRSICRIAMRYEAAAAPSSDALTLGIDGLTATVLGETLPQPSIGAASANPNLAVSVTAVAFANAVTVTTASSETHTVTISNNGAAAFALALATTGDFTSTTDCPATLPGNSTCHVVLGFTPSSPGTRQGLLSVTPGTSAPVYVELTGTGTAILPQNSGSLDFGNVPLNTPSVHWLKVSSSFSALTATASDSNYTVLLVEDSGFGHGQPPSSAFASTATGTCFNCYLGIQFLPLTTSPHAATVALRSPGNGQPEQITVTGEGIPLTGPILTPVMQDFGTVATHSTSGPTIFQLTNGSSTVLTVPTATASGDFSIAANTTGGATCTESSLASGASCFVPIVFMPSASGTRTGTLTLATSQGQVAASLTGIGADDPGIAITPATLAFNNVPGTAATQQTVTITNTGTQPATIGTATVSDTHFSVTSTCSTLAPAASCTETVTYTADATTANGTLTIPITTSPAGAPTNANYVVPLSGLYTSENAGLQIIPGEGSTVNFGSASTGTAAGTRILHVNNTSGTALTLTVESPRQFAVTGSTCAGLAAGASCDLSVTYTPLTSGDITGTIFLQGTPSDGSATRNGLGYLEGYGLGSSTLQLTGDISPLGVLSFGQVASGSTASEVLTLTNPVSSPAGTSITVRRIRSEFPYLSTTTCGAPLGPGASCTVTVTYTPLFQATTSTAPELDTGSLTIETGAANAPLFLDINGQASPAIVTTPTNTAPLTSFTTSQGSLTFPATSVGSASPAQAVTLANTGTQTLHIRGLITQPSFAATTDCSTLVAGASCSISVAFHPQAPGGTLGSLEIQTDGSASLEFVSLYGAASAASVTIAPQSIDFGRVLVSKTSTQAVTFTNTGSTPVTFNGDTVTGASFALAATSTASNPCPAAGSAIAPNTSCTVSITFAPTVVGTVYGSVAISTSATPLPLTASLSGTGTQPQLVVSPASLAFGDVALGSSRTLSLTLSNVSTTPVDGLAFAATKDFTIASTCGITTVNAGSSCSVSVTYTPSTLGAIAGALTISSTDPASPVTVPLTGNASAASVTLTPLAIDYGSVALKQAATQALTLTNTGTTPVVYNGASIAGTAFTFGTSTIPCPAAGSTLPAAATCVLNVTFTPPAAGTYAGSVSVSTAATALPLTATLTGTGTQPQLTVAPTSLAFGSIPLGSSSTLSLTVSNNGNSSTTGLALAVTTGFTTTTNCGATLSAASICTVSITATPTAIGTANGALTVTSANPLTTITVPLTSTAIPSGNSSGGFTLTVNGASSASASVQSGLPATYAVSVTPTGGYTGNVALTCTAGTPVNFAYCSITPPNLTLASAAQGSTVTITTVSAVDSLTSALPANRTGIALCLAPAAILLAALRRRRITALLAILFVMTIFSGGCGSGGDNRIRYAAPGTYTFRITAASTNATPASQTVTATLTITPR